MAEPDEKHVPISSLTATDSLERDKVLIDSADIDESDAQGYTNGIALAIVLIADLLAVFLVATTNFAEWPEQASHRSIPESRAGRLVRFGLLPYARMFPVILGQTLHFSTSEEGILRLHCNLRNRQCSLWCVTSLITAYAGRATDVTSIQVLRKTVPC
jgi:hypothetical protein